METDREVHDMVTEVHDNHHIIYFRIPKSRQVANQDEPPRQISRSNILHSLLSRHTHIYLLNNNINEEKLHQKTIHPAGQQGSVNNKQCTYGTKK